MVLVTLLNSVDRLGDDVHEDLVTLFECCTPSLISERLELVVLVTFLFL